MKRFTILPHTADVRLKVFGKTKEELFENALLAMAEILQIKNSKFKGQNYKSKIKIQSIDLNSLLADFLSEVLYQSQINQVVYADVKFSKFLDSSAVLGQAELEAEIFGNRVGHFKEEIKAVTYHELEIKKSPEGFFETTVVFDV